MSMDQRQARFFGQMNQSSASKSKIEVLVTDHQASEQAASQVSVNNVLEEKQHFVG